MCRQVSLPDGCDNTVIPAEAGIHQRARMPYLRVAHPSRVGIEGNVGRDPCGPDMAKHEAHEELSITRSEGSEGRVQDSMRCGQARSLEV